MKFDLKNLKMLLFSKKALPLMALLLVTGTLGAIRWASLRDEAVYIPQNQSPAVAAGAENPDRLAEAAGSSGDFFKDFRAQRERARQDEIELLNSIVERENAPIDSVREADKRKVALTQFYEQERGIEKMLIAKGFEDAAAFIQEGSVTIIVRSEKLSELDNDKILEVALRESKQDAANIKIIPVA
ncbi:MAG: SpoIIIAH-like family protein [Christensenellaceae bacterium]|nr:SpoIIIAH-like family protein [Christensenellaceae bacterium]